MRVAQMYFSAETDFAIYLFSFLFIGGAATIAVLIAYHTVQK